MDQWEYFVLELKSLNPRKQAERMNELGAKGWELVSVIQKMSIVAYDPDPEAEIGWLEGRAQADVDETYNSKAYFKRLRSR